MSTQIGTPFSDNLFGGSGNDNLFGSEGNDNLFGGGGNDNLFGEEGDDNLFGEEGDDNLFGGPGNDVIFGSAGNDIVGGDEGIDTLDYTGLGQAITLFADRTEKGGGLGSDRPNDPPSTEIIIADPGFVNVVDVSGTDLASLIDLRAEKFDIFDVPNIITIKNFVNVIGSNQNDTIIGNQFDNILIGGGGDDVFVGSAGNDIYDGGDGLDTLDYTGLGQAVTILAGRIEKGGLGIDRNSGDPDGIEIIIGDPSFVNVVDLSGTDLASLIDLRAEKFNIFDFSGAITIKNFVNVIGSNQNDTIIGNQFDNILIGGGGDDVFVGSAGNDIYDGGDGINTLDYTGLGQAITFFPDRIEKGNLGTDREVVPTVIKIVIGDVGFANTIDSSILESPVSVDVDLSKESLAGVNISGVVNTIGTVKNFVNVIGTKQNDRIVGNELNNIINGFGGRDTLFGGAGQDTFVLGENGNVLYRNSGFEDVAIIEDFVSGVDKIQITGNRSDYSFFNQGSTNFIALDNGNGQFDFGVDEVIASLNSSFNVANDLIFV